MAIREAARGAGMRTLEEEGRRLVEEGVTTEVEVTRVVQGVA
jgi:type II secretory ATPase GspE/PulE/Tfp pilus assembly ATPase PilB-like protein